MSQPLEDSRGAHASSNAHGDHAVPRVAALQFANQAGRKLCSGAAQRMTERDGSAVWIYARRIEICLLNHGQ